MNDLDKTISKFSPISLKELNNIRGMARLLRRDDTKYLFREEKLIPFLEKLTDQYKILEINNKRAFRYENLYFDTEDSLFYRQHHNRKMNRYKLRYRKYADEDLHYWEIKLKKNRRKTIKKRFKQESPIEEITSDIKETTKEILPEHIDIDLDKIEPKIWISFQRITLANLDLEERVTIDTNIKYENLKGEQKELEDIVIAELKQPKLSLTSPFARIAKNEKIYSRNFSKYCTGIILLEKPAKIGRFKRRIIALEGELR